MASLNVHVVSPDKTLFEGEAASVVAPAWDGQVGILPGHAPMLALIGSGALSVDRPGGGSDTFYVAGGVMKVERDTVTLLTEYAGEGAPHPMIRAGALEHKVPYFTTASAGRAAVEAITALASHPLEVRSLQSYYSTN